MACSSATYVSFIIAAFQLMYCAVMRCFKSYPFNLGTKILRCDHLSKGSSITVFYGVGRFPFLLEGDSFFLNLYSGHSWQWMVDGILVTKACELGDLFHEPLVS